MSIFEANSMEKGMTMEKIMTAKELSQFLKLSESTIYKLASNGNLPGFKIGDSWRFELEEIQKLIRTSKKRAGRQRDSLEERKEKVEAAGKDQ
jgi:excisionase family DNA binding protein